MITDRRTFIAFIYGFTLMGIYRVIPSYPELSLLIAFLATFWRPLIQLFYRVQLDHQAAQLEKQLKRTVHVNANPMVAYLALVGEL